MKFRTFSLIGLVAFALGAGATLQAGAAPAPTCNSTCASKCLAAYNSCLANGISEVTCSRRYASCISGCRCPVP